MLLEELFLILPFDSLDVKKIVKDLISLVEIYAVYNLPVVGTSSVRVSQSHVRFPDVLELVDSLFGFV